MFTFWAYIFGKSDTVGILVHNWDIGAFGILVDEAFKCCFLLLKIYHLWIKLLNQTIKMTSIIFWQTFYLTWSYLVFTTQIVSGMLVKLLKLLKRNLKFLICIPFINLSVFSYIMEINDKNVEISSIFTVNCV